MQAVPQDVAAILAENTALKAQLAQYGRQLAERDRRLAEYGELVARLNERIAELERKKGKNSRNSGKPPSSDGLAKPRAKERSKRGSRSSGGQPGHRGSTLRRSETPDHIADHFPKVCKGCGSPLDRGNAEVDAARQVHDLPEPRPLEVTEHRVHACDCARCGSRTVADFPEGVGAPVQYGPNVGALVAYLSVAQLIPLNRIRQVLHTMHGLSLSEGTIHSMIRRAAARHAEFHRFLRRVVASAPVKHFDETGMRVAGMLRWLHVGSTASACHLRLGKGRGDVMTEATGIAVHDHWRPYFKRLENVLHALCSAHLVRECQAKVDADDEIWAENMRDLLYEAMSADRGGHLTEGRIAEIEEHYDALVGDGIAHHMALPPLPSKRKRNPKLRPGHNLVNRLRDFRTEILRFLHNPAVPATNNMGEQDLRCSKVKQKISGSFRTVSGIKDFAILRSSVETARKRGWNALSTLQADADQLIALFGEEGPIPDS